MFDALIGLPFPFWVVSALLLCGSLWAVGKIRDGTGLPILAVLLTISAWYVVDLFYNDYEFYTATFSPNILADAWSQVALFLLTFLLIVPFVHQFLNAYYLRHVSSVLRIFRTGVNDPLLQQRLKSLLWGSVFVWVALLVIATIRLGSEIPYYVFPFLDHKNDPWGRGRLGSGIDALLSVAAYVQLFASASFGIVAALSTNPRVRRIAVLGCAVAWPYYIFDRTRNVMLSALMPGVLAWTFMRLRGGWGKKIVALGAFFVLLSAWFGFVIANRASMTITAALDQKGFDIAGNASVHHDGLNMFEELCWINVLVNDAEFQPSWGELYLAEVVSPIPRAWWPDKPAPGLQYAMARGQEEGVGATISTGMIGQAVVSFGRFAGPPFAALLMSIWVAILARLDLRGRDVTLYGLGLVLTFNLGRDITFITLYTFVFGVLLVWSTNRLNQTDRRQLRTPRRPRPAFQQGSH